MSQFDKKNCLLASVLHESSDSIPEPEGFRPGRIEGVLEQDLQRAVMLISVRASATYEVSKEAFVLLMVEPAREAPDHRVREAKLETTPAPMSILGQDYVGNPMRRLIVPAGEFRYDYTA